MSYIYCVHCEFSKYEKSSGMYICQKSICPYDATNEEKKKEGENNEKNS